jgi:AbrB family looped-hinge helix DNA binding protein
MSAPARRRVVQVEADGQITVPADLREKLGLKRGDLVSVVETSEGLLLTNETLIANRDHDLVDGALKKQGLSLDELVESGREIRGDLLKELYGLDE